VKVSVRKTGGRLKVSVEDDGVGFLEADTSKKGRFGLFSAREQLEHFGGRLEIESEPGRGTTATIVIPVEELAMGYTRRGCQ